MAADCGVRLREKGPLVQIPEYIRKMIPTTISGSYPAGQLVALSVHGRMAYLVKPTKSVDAQKRWVWVFPFWLISTMGTAGCITGFTSTSCWPPASTWRGSTWELRAAARQPPRFVRSFIGCSREWPQPAGPWCRAMAG